MGQGDPLDGILMSLHEAALDDQHWLTTSRLIDEACRTKGNSLVFGERRVQDDAQVIFARFCQRGQRRQDWEREYFEVYHPRDERAPRVAQLPDSRLVHVTDLYTAEEIKTSPTYNEALAKSDRQNSLNARLAGPDGSHVVWGTGDPIDAGGWGSAQVQLLERLLPHLRHFVRVRDAMAAAEILGATLTEMLGASRSGVVYLDRRGRIVEANDRARALLRRGDGLSDRGGFLRATVATDDDRLQGLLARALPPFGGRGLGASTTVGRSPGVARLVVRINPLGNRQLEFAARHVAALVLIEDPGSHPPIDPALVVEVLGLTRGEAEVAVWLAEGRSVTDMAAATGRQETSVRFHLKRTYKKLGISRQAELVRLVLSLAGDSRSRH